MKLLVIYVNVFVKAQFHFKSSNVLYINILHNALHLST